MSFLANERSNPIARTGRSSSYDVNEDGLSRYTIETVALSLCSAINPKSHGQWMISWIHMCEISKITFLPKLAFTFVIFLGFLTTTITEARPDRPLTPEETRHWPRIEREDGRKNPVVIAIQYLLHAHGHELVVDGIFGMQTLREVKKFQTRHGIKNNGIVDDFTWELLVIGVKSGSQGDAVRAVQARLKGHGHHLPLTGFFGPRTRKAVALFQSAHSNLIATGVVDSGTWCHLVNGRVAP